MKKLIIPINLILALCVATASAELPQLTEKPFMGNFAALKTKDYQVTLSPKGDILVNPVFEGGDIRPYCVIPVSWGIKLVGPKGVRLVYKVLPESLQSKDEATDELLTTTLTGKTENGASLELLVKTDRKSVQFSVRIVDPGPWILLSPKLQYSPWCKIYTSVAKTILKTGRKKFRELVEDDFVKISRVDRSKEKFDAFQVVKTDSPEFTGAGIETLQTEFKIIKKSYTFTASSGSAIFVTNQRLINAFGKSEGKVPLHKGYDMTLVTGDKGGSLTIGVD